MKFSLIYPTCHRPNFIQKALQFLSIQNYEDFEVIICDNYTDKNFSCEKICKTSKFKIKNLKYIYPHKPLGMVENWNYALEYAQGDYICYLTDKTFVLPNTLQFVANVIKTQENFDIISWVGNMYTAYNLHDYFGSGIYSISSSSVKSDQDMRKFDPLEELSKKGQCRVSRKEQSPSDYARGKLCFGCYSKELITKIKKKAGKVFHDISPDYTSMILGLSLATSAVELKFPGVVQVNTDISNGKQVDINNTSALNFIKSLGDPELILGELLVPGLYSSQHNIVAHDYLKFKNLYSLNFDFNQLNWLVHITEDIHNRHRIWSSDFVKQQQQKLLKDFIKNNLSVDEYEQYKEVLAIRAKQQRLRKNINSIKYLARYFIPNSIWDWVRKASGIQVIKMDSIDRLFANLDY